MLFLFRNSYRCLLNLICLQKCTFFGICVSALKQRRFWSINSVTSLQLYVHIKFFFVERTVFRLCKNQGKCSYFESYEMTLCNFPYGDLLTLMDGWISWWDGWLTCNLKHLNVNEAERLTEWRDAHFCACERMNTKPFKGLTISSDSCFVSKQFVCIWKNSLLVVGPAPSVLQTKQLWNCVTSKSLNHW